MKPLQFIVDYIWGSSCETLVGKVQTNITIYAQKSDKQLWDSIDGVIYTQFTETPVLYTIAGQSSASFVLNTPTKVVSCTFVNNVDVKGNTCMVRRSVTESGTDFKATLNYPVEISIEIHTGQTATLTGFYDQNELFHVTKLFL